MEVHQHEMKSNLRSMKACSLPVNRRMGVLNFAKHNGGADLGLPRLSAGTGRRNGMTDKIATKSTNVYVLVAHLPT
eukprot:4735618-Pleurochrysis_carterae.AAC.1